MMIAHGRTMTSMPTADNEHVFAALERLGTPPAKAMCTLCIHMRAYERKHQVDFGYVLSSEDKRELYDTIPRDLR
jgi:hypothetical protein